MQVCPSRGIPVPEEGRDIRMVTGAQEEEQDNREDDVDNDTEIAIEVK